MKRSPAKVKVKDIITTFLVYSEKGNTSFKTVARADTSGGKGGHNYKCPQPMEGHHKSPIGPRPLAMAERLYA